MVTRLGCCGKPRPRTVLQMCGMPHKRGPRPASTQLEPTIIRGSSPRTPAEAQNSLTQPPPVLPTRTESCYHAEHSRPRPSKPSCTPRGSQRPAWRASSASSWVGSSRIRCTRCARSRGTAYHCASVLEQAHKAEETRLPALVAIPLVPITTPTESEASELEWNSDLDEGDETHFLPSSHSDNRDDAGGPADIFVNEPRDENGQELPRTGPELEARTGSGVGISNEYNQEPDPEPQAHSPMSPFSNLSVSLSDYEPSTDEAREGGDIEDDHDGHSTPSLNVTDDDPWSPVSAPSSTLSLSDLTDVSAAGSDEDYDILSPRSEIFSPLSPPGDLFY
ncbi:hypothetical protein C8Q73DRAFT_321154 [Cubamyces lactineus]|nr:hypothetical protein C8Q73DRAFT_321154 [Cubamyces lactineus]